MLSIFNSYNTCVLKNDNKLRALPIGGLFSLSNAPMFSDKKIALKQDLNTILLISHCSSPIICVIDECVPHMHIWHKYIYLHIPTDALNVASSLLLDYTSFSQSDWRYIRYMFGRTSTVTALVHIEFFDVLTRLFQNFHVPNLKSTFLMFMLLCHSNISIYSWFCNMFLFFRWISSSRNNFNIYNMDVFSNLIVEENIISDADDHSLNLNSSASDFDDDDDDIEYKASQVALDASYFALEEQISVAGFLLNNHIYSFTEISVFFYFSYFDLYIRLSYFFSLYFIRFMSQFLFFFMYTRMFVITSIILQHVTLMCSLYTTKLYVYY